MGLRVEVAPWGRGCKSVFEVLKGYIFEATKVFAFEVKKEHVSEVRQEVVFEAKRDIVFEERKETVFEATKDVALVATKHSWFHVLSLVAQLNVGIDSVYRIAQVSVQDQSQMQPWLHSDCMAPRPRQL